MGEREPDERDVARLRAQGLTYRRIARELGIPLTRAYKLAQQAPPEEPPEPAPEPQDPAEEAPAPEPPQPLGAFGFALLRGRYTMPGPRGTVLVVDTEP